jgi:hypothetical protein
MTTQLMQNRLAGLARAWYNNLTTYAHTWEEWKALLIKTFPVHHDFANTLRQMLNRVKQPNESMTQYYFGKMNLLQACNITDKEAVSCIIDGLLDDTQKVGAKAGRYETPELLYAEYLSTLTTNTYELRDTMPRSRFEHTPRSRFEDAFRRQRPRRETGELYQPRERPINTNLNESAVETSGYQCFNCHESGHTSRTCPKPRVI